MGAEPRLLLGGLYESVAADQLRLCLTDRALTYDGYIYRGSAATLHQSEQRVGSMRIARIEKELG